VDGEGERRADPNAGQTFTVGDPYCHAGHGNRAQVELTSHVFRHEAVGRPRVHQGDEGLVAHGHTQSHLASGHAGECVAGDLDVRVIYKDVPREVITVHLEEVDPLSWSTA
jgi:hypothetical protein